ncbi:hypothetical protein [Saccharothrix obliqua]|uniref:hypothetical protein n=1 Tax=Saccharothrix obliqua TaxID=2861747 RepID=UPI001C5FA2B1|nr:hypothetical protein [Saccharothrix obliqua]MBW4716765.1 hypothetical protein [Saccharothrix obliqua]
MTGTRLRGVAAIRAGWARPDEPVLLCADAGGSATRFDVRGLEWSGKPAPGFAGRALWGVANVAAGVAGALADDHVDARQRPDVVVFGPSPDSIAARAALQVRGVPLAWLVLTPHRLAWLRDAPEAESEPGPEKSLLDRVGGFARDVFADRDPYPPAEPVPTADVLPVVEVPRAEISGVGAAERKLPSGAVPRQAHVLRVSFVDGSGVDVVAARAEDLPRLVALASGR